MEKQELIKFAVKGIEAEIREHEKVVEKGEHLLKEMSKGRPVKTTMTKKEIENMIVDHQEQIEQLDSKKFDLEWELHVK